MQHSGFLGSGISEKGAHSAGAFRERLSGEDLLELGLLIASKNAFLLSCHAVNVLSVLTRFGCMHFFWKLVPFLENLIQKSLKI